MTDGNIAVRFKPVSGRVDQAAGLVWRYRDANNYYIVRANALEDNVVLYKVENGRRSPLGPIGRSDDYGVKHTVPAEQWSTLAVAFRVLDSQSRSTARSFSRWTTLRSQGRVGSVFGRRRIASRTSTASRSRSGSFGGTP